jgi:hypothetical protein
MSVETKAAKFTGTGVSVCILVQRILVCYTRTEIFIQSIIMFPAPRPSIHLWHKDFCKTTCFVCSTKKTDKCSLVEEKRDRFPSEFYANQRDMRLGNFMFLIQRCVSR